MSMQDHAAELARLTERISALGAQMDANAAEAARVWGGLADASASSARAHFQRQAVARIVRKYL